MIESGNLIGSGIIRANGGTGFFQNPTGWGGGGGGGRIAIYTDVMSLSGVHAANAGSGFQRGGAGSVYIIRGTTEQLIFSGGGATGARTRLPAAVQIIEELVVASGAVVFIDHTMHADHVSVINNGQISHTEGASNGLHLTVTGDVLIDASSRIDVSGRGFAGGEGPGAGQSGVDSDGGVGREG